MIYFECYSDQAFLTGIGVSLKNTEHSFSKGNVCNKLQKNNGSIGLADEDPGEIQPRFIRYLTEAQRIVYKDQYLILFSDPKTKNRLILIRPNIEGWTIRIAQELKIDLNALSLPTDENGLHEALGFAKNQNQLKSFKELFTLVAAHPSVVRIKEFVK